ncbi:MAG: 5'/3'-nucleotidase SurE [Anaerolineales bacterium]|nr:5'/3'-nucleotidase SurE [Anaerolineales bacterium]
MTKDKSKIINRKSEIPLIVLVNDDGIQSPGLRALAEALRDLGELLIVAPRDQQTSRGRAFIGGGVAEPVDFPVDGKRVRAFAVAASPAMAVRYAVLVCAQRRPALIVSGINYGENVGNGVTISGTIGAALEAASMGFPVLAVSRVVHAKYHFTHSDEIDFAMAAHFGKKFARRILERGMPRGVDVVNVNVPENARATTPWRWTRVSRRNYYRSIIAQTPRGKSLDTYELCLDPETPEPDSDVRAVMIDHVVSVSPLTLDLTAHMMEKEKARWGK